MDKDQTIAEIAEHYEAILRLIGEDPSREGLQKTPLRAAKALYDCTVGYQLTPEQVINGAVFDQPDSGMVIVKDIEFYSFCEHHILPFFGTVSVAYLPKGKIIGISKLARLVNLYARRLQVQERFTAEVCRALFESIDCEGVIVACNAQHLCMKMRGVEKQDASTTTIKSVGVFADSPEMQRRFFEALKM